MLFFSVRYDFLYFIYFHKLIKINILFLYINNLKDLELGITFRIFTDIFAIDYLVKRFTLTLIALKFNLTHFVPTVPKRSLKNILFIKSKF